MRAARILWILCAILVFGPMDARASLIVDTASIWPTYGYVGSGNFGSGEAFIIQPGVTSLENIEFTFHSGANGQQFRFVLSPAPSGDPVLYESLFTVTDGRGFVTVNQSVTSGEVIFAMIDYQGYSGNAEQFMGNVYPHGYYLTGFGDHVGDIRSYDISFVAKFGISAVPEPCSLSRLAIGAIGLFAVRRRRQN